jgi:hypothetical protein
MSQQAASQRTDSHTVKGSNVAGEHALNLGARVGRTAQITFSGGSRAYCGLAYGGGKVRVILLAPLPTRVVSIRARRAIRGWSIPLLRHSTLCIGDVIRELEGEIVYPLNGLVGIKADVLPPRVDASFVETGPYHLLPRVR